jgi:hypothetical protein
MVGHRVGLDVFLTKPLFPFLTHKRRGGSGLIFLGLGQAQVVAFGLGLLKFKIKLEALKSRALIVGLTIFLKNYRILLHKPT